MIYGIGIDLVKVARIERVLGRYGDRFLRPRLHRRAKSPIAGASPGPHAAFAMRFAAKEAFSKALGVGLRQNGIRWREVEVIPNPLGKPELFVSGRAAATLRRSRHHRHAPLPHRRRRPGPGRGDFGAVMPEDTPTCRIHEKYRIGIKCANPALPGDPDGFCILHSQIREKTQRTLGKRCQRQMAIRKTRKDMIFSRVFFPGPFDPMIFLSTREFKKPVNFSGATFTGGGEFFQGHLY